MKILHINDYYAPVGGVEVYLHTLCRLLADDGHENAVLFGSHPAASPLDSSPHVYFIPGISRPAWRGMTDRLRRVEQIIAEEKPDLIYFHEILNAPLVEFLVQRKPSVRFVHGFKTVCPSGRKLLNRSHRVCSRPAGLACQCVTYRERCMPRNPRVGLPLLWTALRMGASHRRHTQLIVASHFMHNLLRVNNFPEDHLHVIPYFTASPPQSLLNATRRRGILCVTRLTPEKGVDLLLHAFARLAHQNVHLTVAGEGEALSSLQRLCDVLGVAGRVSFTGRIPHEQISPLFGSAELVVVPSLWPEPFGIVGIEAMAHGCPVVAFDTGGISEWLDHGVTGFLVPWRDVEGMRSQIDWLLDHPVESRQMGQAGYRAVEAQFTPTRHLTLLATVFTRALSAWSQS